VKFQWPAAILFTLIVPAFLWLYVRIEQRRRVAARAHAALYAHPSGLAARHPLVRHIPFALFLLSLIVLGLALARPQLSTAMFAIKGTVVLALDASTSMKADDERPHRMAWAQAQAKEFVAQYADDYKIGLVSFGASAVAEIEPTTDREALFAAIDRLVARPGTAIGNGIAAALAMVFPQTEIEIPPGDSGAAHALSVKPKNVAPRATQAEPRAAAAIVLFSDGQSSSGPDPIAAARYAAGLGVRIHTVGVGSAEGRTMRLEGWSMRVQLDEPVLKEIAAATHGAYFRPSTAIAWPRVLNSIQPEAPRDDAYTEITALFAAVAALAAISCALISLAWSKRVL